MALIIVGGFGVLLFRDQAVTFLNDNAGVSQSNLTGVIAKPTNKDTLDNSLLNSNNFVALKNNVSKFDFELICNNSVGTIESVSTSSTGVVSTSTIIVNCAKGNSNPFPIPKPKEK